MMGEQIHDEGSRARWVGHAGVNGRGSAVPQRYVRSHRDGARRRPRGGLRRPPAPRGLARLSLRRQAPEATVKGFVNHRWNGLTTLHFARLCEGIIARGLALPHLQHVAPAGSMTKAAMLHAFAAAFRRPDIRIEDVEAGTIIDRTLDTITGDVNRRLWEAAGYPDP